MSEKDWFHFEMGFILQKKLYPYLPKCWQAGNSIMIQTNFNQLLTFTDSRDKSFYFGIKGPNALSDDSFTKYSENY